MFVVGRGICALVKRVRPRISVHTAAQPSHDRAAEFPFEDCDTNAVGALNLLEVARQSCWFPLEIQQFKRERNEEKGRFQITSSCDVLA
jgi:nucleoside-diphosphate-sugar epimerase